MIEVAHLTKEFGDFTAVEDVSFTVEAGECVGFLGPNGAGKTTTMRVIAGIFPPSAGHGARRRPRRAARPVRGAPPGRLLPRERAVLPRDERRGVPRVRRAGEAPAARGAARRDRPRAARLHARRGAAPAGRQAQQGLPAARRARPGAARRSAGPGPRRADLRPRPRAGDRDPRAGEEPARPAHHRVLEPHPVRGRARWRSAWSSSTAAGSSPRTTPKGSRAASRVR